MKKMVNVAVIGVGNIGKHHARIYSGMPDVKLIAVSDINEEVGKTIAKKYNCKFYRDYKVMLKKEKIDAVSIAVPTALHKSVALDVIDAGMHLLVEKPIAITTKNAKQIIMAAEKKNVKLMVGHVERFNPAVRKLKEMLDNGKLGIVTTIITRRVGLFPPQIKDANVVIDLATHDIDVCNYLLGKKPTSIYAKAGKALTNKREDYADIFLKYGDVDVIIQVNWITPVKIRSLAITGTKGYGELNYITQELKIYKSSFEKLTNETFDEIIKFSQANEIRVDIDKKEPLEEELNAFISYINGGECPMSSKDALIALKIANAVIDSYKGNKLIFL